MNTKKLAAFGASAALFLSIAAPAFATRWHMPFFRSEDELSIENHDTDLDVNVDVVSDTGDNSIRGTSEQPRLFSWFGGNHNSSGDLRTGNATVGLVDVLSDVNFTDVVGCGCFDDITIKNHDTDVDVDVDVRADSGDNRLHGRGNLWTGNAGVAAVYVDSFVNTTTVGGVRD